jgi:hypothetical protein
MFAQRTLLHLQRAQRQTTSTLKENFPHLQPALACALASLAPPAPTCDMRPSPHICVHLSVVSDPNPRKRGLSHCHIFPTHFPPHLWPRPAPGAVDPRKVLATFFAEDIVVHAIWNQQQMWKCGAPGPRPPVHNFLNSVRTSLSRRRRCPRVRAHSARHITSSVTSASQRIFKARYLCSRSRRPSPARAARFIENSPYLVCR